MPGSGERLVEGGDDGEVFADAADQEGSRDIRAEGCRAKVNDDANILGHKAFEKGAGVLFYCEVVLAAELNESCPFTG